ncbi:MAG: TonB-dependent receptor, partial [Pedobacter sp.]
GLIYVNPEGPNANHDPLSAAKDIRQAFGRMAMNDEETIALIAGGHTFGKAHGAHKPDCLGAPPAAAGIEQQGTGWKNDCGKGNAEDTMTSGLEGAWSVNPTAWTHQYFENLFAFEWVKTKSPAGATQWIPEKGQAANLVPDAHIKSKRHAPIMFTTDIALRVDPAYSKISKRFHDHPEEFEKAFARAWFKLTHRDMGPRARYLGPDVPSEILSWQDPIPSVSYQSINDKDIEKLKADIAKSGLTGTELIETAWASASTFRYTDMRGGANGGRVRLEPQKSWKVNEPKELNKVISKLEGIQKQFNQSNGNRKVSIADLIVLGGSYAVEQAAKKGGYNVKVAFKPGRADASQAQTDVQSFNFLEPKADGFRNYYTNASYVFNNTLAPGATVVTLVDPGIKWERKVTSNAAIEVGMMNEKLHITAEYFKNTNKDLLAGVPIPLSIGSFPWEVTTNAASMENHGIELTVNYRGSSGDFTYDVSLNGNTLKNKLLSLGLNGVPVPGNASRSEPGRSVGDLYGHKVIGIFQNVTEVQDSPDQVNAAPGDLKFQDTDGNG